MIIRSFYKTQTFKVKIRGRRGVLEVPPEA